MAEIRYGKIQEAEKQIAALQDEFRAASASGAMIKEEVDAEDVAEVVSRCGSNVVSVQHDGSDPNMPISSCFLKLGLETRDHTQIEQIKAKLTEEGFKLVSERA